MKEKIKYALVGGMAASMFLCFALEANGDGENGASSGEETYMGMQEGGPGGPDGGCAPQGCEQVCAPVCPTVCCQPCQPCQPCPDICCPTICCANFRFSVRAGGFYPTRRVFRKTFGHTGAFYGAEAAYTFCGCVTAFINGDYYNRSGHPCCTIRKSKVNLCTGSLGICFPLKLCSCIEPYVGIGALVGRARFKDRFEYDYCDFAEESRCSKTAFGGVLKSGIIIPFSCCWFGEIFCDYVYLPMHFERKINLGGAKFGGGIGVRF